MAPTVIVAKACRKAPDIESLLLTVPTVVNARRRWSKLMASVSRSCGGSATPPKALCLTFNNRCLHSLSEWLSRDTHWVVECNRT